jgi:hypothetical protein
MTCWGDNYYTQAVARSGTFLSVSASQRLSVSASQRLSGLQSQLCSQHGWWCRVLGQQ